jgi:hypothetical protein
MTVADLLRQEGSALAEREAQPADPPPAVTTAPAEPLPAAAGAAPQQEASSATAARPKLAAAPNPVSASEHEAASPTAMELVANSCASARNHPRDWEQASVRLPLQLTQRLSVRVAQDKQASGNRQLAATHYINAALGRVPFLVDPAAERPGREPPAGLLEAATLGLAWRQAHSGPRSAAAVAGSRLHKDTAARMSSLGDWLRTLKVHPVLWEVMAEALTRFLAELDMPAPEPAGSPQPLAGSLATARPYATGSDIPHPALLDSRGTSPAP